MGTNETTMSVRRALIVGLGRASAATLNQLHNRITEKRAEGIPVIQTILIDDNSGEEKDSLPHSKYFRRASLDNIDQITTEAINDVRLQKHITTLQQQDIQVDTQHATEIMFVASLADTHITENIIRIAQRIYAVVVKAESGTLSLTSAILVVPEDTSVQAHARQTLQKIDTFLADAAQWQDAPHRAIQRVYLLEPNNEANIRLQSTESLFWMTGDWLYHYFVGNLNPSANIVGSMADDYERRFRTLGYASLFVPLGTMMDVLSTWFVNDTYKRYLLAPSSLTKEDAVTSWEANGLGASEIEQTLKQDVTRLSISVIKYSNTPFYRYQLLEQQVATDYTAQIERTGAEQITVPREKNRIHIIDKFRQGATTIQHERLNNYDKAPVQTTIRFFDFFYQEIQERLNKQQTELQKQEQAIRGFDRTIVETRQAFWDAAEVFGQPPFWFPVAAVVIAILVSTTVAQMFWSLPILQPMSIVLIVATMVAAAGTVFFAQKLADSKKIQLIKCYADRLAKVVEQQETRTLRDIYRVLLNILTKEYIEPLNNKKTQLMKHVPDETVGRFHIAPDVAQRIAGPQGHELEVSVVTEQHIQQHYTEQFGDSVDREVQEFFSLHKPFSEWLKESPDVLRDAIVAWVRGQKLNTIAASAKVADYLGTDTQRQQEIVRNMLNSAKGYSRINRAELNDNLRGTQEFFRVGASEHDAEWIKTLFPQQSGEAANAEVTGDVKTDTSLRVVAMSVLPGLPLAAHMAITNIAMGGNYVSELSLVDELTDGTFSYEELVALAAALGILDYKDSERTFGYQARDEIQSFRKGEDVLVFQPLADSTSNVLALIRDTTNTDKLTTIYQQTKKALMEIFSQDGKGQQLVNKLYDHIEQSYNIEQWEIDILKQYCTKLIDKVSLNKGWVHGETHRSHL